MTSLSPWTAMRCMWLRSQAHRGKPEGHACHTSPRSVSSRRFAGFAQKAATHRCNGLDVPTFRHHHHATAPPHIRQGSPLLRIERKPLESLAALALFTFAFLGSELFFDMRHGHAYAAGGRRVSTSTYPRRKRYRHPRPHCALEASASSDPDTLHRSRGSHHQSQAVERPAVLLQAIRRSAPPLSPSSS